VFGDDAIQDQVVLLVLLELVHLFLGFKKYSKFWVTLFDILSHFWIFFIFYLCAGNIGLKIKIQCRNVDWILPILQRMNKYVQISNLVYGLIL
jgi:hypothetical protein